MKRDRMEVARAMDPQAALDTARLLCDELQSYAFRAPETWAGHLPRCAELLNDIAKKMQLVTKKET